MEELKKVIATAVEEGVKKALKNVNVSTNGKEPNELLTVEQVHKEFGIGVSMVRKMFKDTNLPVQRYTTPFKVTRQAIEKYMNEHHDYLSEKS